MRPTELDGYFELQTPIYDKSLLQHLSPPPHPTNPYSNRSKQMLWRLNIDPSIWSRRCQFPIQTAIYANGQTTYQQFMPVSLQLAAGMDASGKEDKSANEFHAQQMGRIQPWWRSRTGYRFPSNSRQNRNHVIQTTSSKKIYLATERMKIKHQMLESSLVFFLEKANPLFVKSETCIFNLLNHYQHAR